MARNGFGWALTTGASAGIGEAFARRLAQEGYPQILLARRRDKLDALARELTAKHGVSTRVIEADLSEPEAPARIAEQVADLPLQIFVNNAGYGLAGGFLANEWSEHERFLQVMLGSVTELCYRLLPKLLDCERAYLINIASIAGLIPAPAGHTLYPAVKAYMISMSQSLHAEFAERGLYVSALCPGFTYSEFHDVAGTREMVSKLPSRMWQSAAEVADSGWLAAQRGDTVYVPGSNNKLLSWLMRTLPRSVAQGIVNKRAGDFRKV